MITSKEQLFSAYPKKAITLDLPDVEGLSMVFLELSPAFRLLGSCLEWQL